VFSSQAFCLVTGKFFVSMENHTPICGFCPFFNDTFRRSGVDFPQKKQGAAIRWMNERKQARF